MLLLSDRQKIIKLLEGHSNVHFCVGRPHPMTRVLWYFEFTTRNPAVYQSEALGEVDKTWKSHRSFCTVLTQGSRCCHVQTWLQVAAGRALHCSAWKQDANTSFPQPLQNGFLSSTELPMDDLVSG